MKIELNKLRYDRAEIDLIVFALSDIVTTSQGTETFGGTDSSDDSWTKPN